MENQKIIIGARTLTRPEIQKTLATYETILEQIKLFRENAQKVLEKSGNEEIDVDAIPQKINNIAILGKRGTGKTSILRTIREELKKESKDTNKKDVLLPIIIPENMSQNNSLMSSIIGMFSDVVAKYESENKNALPCNRNEKSDLERVYRDVVKQFCYIQPQYKNILMDNFTSELEYTKKSSQIFNADQEFIKRFHKFINTLLENCEEKNAMVFIFIDDIDLSTNRCMDVIKTLLSYISHPNIVTFFSGDLDTFEEAITIDFLRQEQALSETVWSGKFINEMPLLERKKELAYEYLKKVAPPVYRHNIKYWSLKNRGGYFIAQKDEKTEMTLHGLLRKLEKKELQNQRFFTMYSEDNEEKALPLTYHLFDETARGLNNMYAVLYDMYQKWQDDKNMDYTDKRNLIDTMIAANPILNGQRDNIDSIIHFNNDNESVDILYDNFIIYMDEAMEDIKAMEDKSENEISELLQKNSKSRKSMFVLFLIIEFIKKLFQEINVTTNSYKKAKIKAIKALLFTPSLHESSALIEKEMMEYIIKMAEEKEDRTENVLFGVINQFFRNGDFLFALNFYEKLVEKGYNFYKAFDFNTFEDKIQLFINIEQALKSFLCQKEKDDNTMMQYLAENYNGFEKSFDTIQRVLSGGKKTLTSEALFHDIINFKEKECEKLYNIKPKDTQKENDETCTAGNESKDNQEGKSEESLEGKSEESLEDKSEESLEGKSKESLEDTLEDSPIYKELRKKLLYNYFIKYYEETIFHIDNITKQILNVKSIAENEALISNIINNKNFDEKQKQKYQKQYDIMKKMDANRLWDSVIFNDKPISNLKECIYEYLKEEIKSLKYIMTDDNFKDKKQKFLSCYSGSSYYNQTVADKSKLNIREIEDKYKPEDPKREYKDIREECEILHKTFSGRGWYGKEEAREWYYAIYKLTWHKEQNTGEKEEEKEEKKNEAIFKLHLYFYAVYKNNTMGNPWSHLDTVVKFDEDITKARELYRKTEETKFTEKINDNELNIDIRDIESLFEEEANKKEKKEGK